MSLWFDGTTTAIVRFSPDEPMSGELAVEQAISDAIKATGAEVGDIYATETYRVGAYMIEVTLSGPSPAIRSLRPGFRPPPKKRRPAVRRRRNIPDFVQFYSKAYADAWAVAEKSRVIDDAACKLGTGNSGSVDRFHVVEDHAGPFTPEGTRVHRLVAINFYNPRERQELQALRRARNSRAQSERIEAYTPRFQYADAHGICVASESAMVAK